MTPTPQSPQRHTPTKVTERQRAGDDSNDGLSTVSTGSSTGPHRPKPGLSLPICAVAGRYCGKPVAVSRADQQVSPPPSEKGWPANLPAFGDCRCSREHRRADNVLRDNGNEPGVAPASDLFFDVSRDLRQVTYETPSVGARRSGGWRRRRATTCLSSHHRWVGKPIFRGRQQEGL
jgi:hypothetical protein